MTSPFSVGTAVAQPGEWTRGRLTLGHYPDAEITTPVNIVCGAHDGPVLWVQAAIHGTEIGGAIALLELFKRIDPSHMHGSIVGIMATNPTAFRSYARNTPLDGENLNRLFPGQAAGPHSRQQVAVLMETASEVADAVMDLHSGGDEAVVPFYCIHWDDGSAAAEASRALARATGTDVIWRAQDEWLKGTMLANMSQSGKPAIIVECGGGGGLGRREIDDFAAAIEGVAQELGILPGQARKLNVVRDLTACQLVFNQRGGYLLPAVEAGATVAHGEVIARVMDAHGAIVEELRAPNGPAYIAAMTRPYLPVHSGSMIAECAQIA